MVNILVGCTGSVASVKLPEIFYKLKGSITSAEIRVVCTERSRHFFDAERITAKIYRDSDEWQSWNKIGDPVLHIDLRNWADIFVIAPLDANTLGKLAHGLCDNLLTCIARAWNIGEKPLIFCPAMNTSMWKHPCTEDNINILKRWSYIEIPPVVKRLACGDEGIGAMASVDDIVNCVVSNLQ